MFFYLCRSRKENLHLSSEYTKLQESYKHLESLKVKLETGDLEPKSSSTSHKEVPSSGQEVRGDQGMKRKLVTLYSPATTIDSALPASLSTSLSSAFSEENEVAPTFDENYTMSESDAVDGNIGNVNFLIPKSRDASYPAAPNISCTPPNGLVSSKPQTTPTPPTSSSRTSIQATLLSSSSFYTQVSIVLFSMAHFLFILPWRFSSFFLVFLVLLLHNLYTYFSLSLIFAIYFLFQC